MVCSLTVADIIERSQPGINIATGNCPCGDLVRDHPNPQAPALRRFEDLIKLALPSMSVSNHHSSWSTTSPSPQWIPVPNNSVKRWQGFEADVRDAELRTGSTRFQFSPDTCVARHNEAEVAECVSTNALLAVCTSTEFHLRSEYRGVRVENHMSVDHFLEVGTGGIPVEVKPPWVLDTLPGLAGRNFLDSALAKKFVMQVFTYIHNMKSKFAVLTSYTKWYFFKLEIDANGKADCSDSVNSSTSGLSSVLRCLTYLLSFNCEHWEGIEEPAGGGGGGNPNTRSSSSSSTSNMKRGTLGPRGGGMQLRSGKKTCTRQQGEDIRSLMSRVHDCAYAGHGLFGECFSTSMNGREVVLKLIRVPSRRSKHRSKDDTFAAIHAEEEAYKQLELLQGICIPTLLFHGYVSPAKFAFLLSNCGETLTSFLQHTTSRKRRAEIAKKLHSALKHIHDAGVTHGDVRSDNIAVDKNQNVWVIDFSHSSLRSPCSTSSEEVIYPDVCEFLTQFCGSDVAAQL